MPEHPDPPRAARDSLVAGSIAVVALVLMLPSVAVRDPWHPDECRYAEVTREMTTDADWLVPHLNAEPYPDKPPVFFWLASLLRLLGAGNSAGILVSIGASVATLVLTYALARLYLPVRSSVLAAAILGTTEMFLWIGRQGVLDPLLTCFTTLAVYGLFRGRSRGEGASSLFYVGMALAVLTKGPVGLLVPGLAALGAVVFGPKPPGASVGRVLGGSVLFSGIVAAWVVPACLVGGADYARNLLLDQNVGRVVSSFAHQKGWYYYLQVVLVIFLPWTPVIALALVHGRRRGSRSAGDFTPALVFWVVATFLAFSIISGKRERYLLPMFPGVAVALAAYLHAVIHGTAGSAWHSRTKLALRVQHAAAAVVGTAVVVASAGLLPGGIFEEEHARYEMLQSFSRSRFAAAGAVLATGVVVLSWLAWKAATAERTRRSVVLGIAAMMTLAWSFDATVLPTVDRLRSPRGLGRFVRELGVERVALLRSDYDGTFQLVLETAPLPILEEPEAMRRFLAEGPTRGIIATRKKLGKLDADLSTISQIVELGSLGRREYVLLRARGDHTAGQGEAAARTQAPSGLAGTSE